MRSFDPSDTDRVFGYARPTGNEASGESPVTVARSHCFQRLVIGSSGTNRVVLSIRPYGVSRCRLLPMTGGWKGARRRMRNAAAPECAYQGLDFEDLLFVGTLQ
jgi:hypothetical protein